MPIVQPTSGGGLNPNMLQLILGLKQMQQDKEQKDAQLKIQQQTAHVAGLTSLIDIAKKTVDPGQLTSLANYGEQQGLGSTADLIDIFRKVQPDTQVLQSFATQQGLKRASGLPLDIYGTSPELESILNNASSNLLTGQGSGQRKVGDFTGEMVGGPPPTPQLQDFFKAHLAGTDPGAMQQSSALAGVPLNVLQQMLRVGGGVELGAGPTAQLGLGYATLRSEDRYHTGELANQEVGFGVDMARIHQMGQTQTSEEVPKLLETQRSIMQEITAKNVNLSQFDLIQRLHALKAVNGQLRAAGVPAPDINPEQDVGKIFEPGFWSHVQAGLTQRGASH